VNKIVNKTQEGVQISFSGDVSKEEIEAALAKSKVLNN